jgi:hypothetical protein
MPQKSPPAFLDYGRPQAGVHAVSIVLDLVQPFRPSRRRIDQLAELASPNSEDRANGLSAG